MPLTVGLVALVVGALGGYTAGSDHDNRPEDARHQAELTRLRAELDQVIGQRDELKRRLDEARGTEDDGG